MADLIKYNDSLKKGTDKLNESIKQSNEAIKNSTDAKQKAEQALLNSESTQTQLDTIVIEGDSSVEAAQARVDAEGKNYTTLKERLDTEHSEVTSQLAQTVAKVNDLGVNASNYSSLQEAIDTLGASGGRVNLPNKTFLLKKPLKIDSNNLEIIGVGKATIRKADNFSGGALITSLIEERTNVTGSLENLIIEDVILDGVDKSVDGMDFSRLTRGCRLNNINIFNAKNGISARDSWSFTIDNSLMNQLSGIGINLTDSVNVASIINNSIRNSNYGIFAERLNGSFVTGNTFELNDYNAHFSGFGSTYSGNYFELPNIENVMLGSEEVPFSGNAIGGNFYDNVGESQGANYLINVLNNHFGANYFRNVIYMYFLTNDSIVNDNEFFIPLLEGIVSFRKEGVSSSYGEILGGNNRVNRGATSVLNTNQTNGGSSAADYRINTTDGNWARFGKITSNSDTFVFTGDGVSDYEFRKPLKFEGDVNFGENSKVGFFGNSPVWPSTITGSTTEQKLDNLLVKLAEYGLINPPN